MIASLICNPNYNRFHMHGVILKLIGAQALIFFGLVFFHSYSLEAQHDSKKREDGYKVVYQSGDNMNGYYYEVARKRYSGNQSHYKILEGNMVNGKLSGFGKFLDFYVVDDAGFYYFKGVSDSARAVNEINLLPNYYGSGPKGEEAFTIRYKEYRYGQYYNGYLVKGVRYKHEYYGRKEIREEGIFHSDYPYNLDYGSYSHKYRDTLVRGFLCMSDISGLYEQCNTTGLRYFIADTSFVLIPFHKNVAISDLLPLPLSEYNSSRSQVHNLRYNGGLYNGESYNGKPEGLGEWISDDGEFVQFGYFKNGLPHGLFSRNFPLSHNETGAIMLSAYSNRPLKGYMVGFYLKGKPVKGYLRDYSNYVGEIDDQMRPHGKGERYNETWGRSESGFFAHGKLHGYGTRIDRDKNVESGEFNNGVLVSGSRTRSVQSLQIYDVVMVGGKKLMVVDKKSDGAGNVSAVLSNGKTLFKNDLFQMASGGNSEFFKVCTSCNGTGAIVRSNTYDLWTGRYDVTTQTKVERLGSYEYINKSTQMKPVYTQRTSYRKERCSACDGHGTLLL